MLRIISKIYNQSPKENIDYIRKFLAAKTNSNRYEQELNKISTELNHRFKVYNTSNLSNITTNDFTEYIQSKIGLIDFESEGYAENELDQQRDFSIKFHWGHDHDFGTFKLKGVLGNRHIKLLSNFINLFPVSIDSFQGKRVFDIGCWTGGTSLLLATIAKSVTSIEEVKKYAEMSNFLANSFGIENRLKVKPMSIYNCNSEDYFEKFDVVYFPGVIYHLSDPLLALRILYNSLMLGGKILIESAGITSNKPICRFEGSKIYHSGSKVNLNRAGWNWFKPSPSALLNMLNEAGFENTQTFWHEPTKRVFGYGEKISRRGICKAGLSVPNIL